MEQQWPRLSRAPYPMGISMVLNIPKSSVSVPSENEIGKTRTSTVGKWQRKSGKPHNSSNNTHKTRPDTEKQRRPPLAGTALRIIPLNPHVPTTVVCEESCHAAQYVANTSVARNLGLRIRYSSEAAIKIGAKEGMHYNRTTPTELHDTKRKGQDEDL